VLYFTGQRRMFSNAVQFFIGRWDDGGDCTAGKISLDIGPPVCSRNEYFEMYTCLFWILPRDALGLLVTRPAVP
jgi:hypothetical protein